MLPSVPPEDEPLDEELDDEDDDDDEDEPASGLAFVFVADSPQANNTTTTASSLRFIRHLPSGP